MDHFAFKEWWNFILLASVCLFGGSGFCYPFLSDLTFTGIEDIPEERELTELDTGTNPGANKRSFLPAKTSFKNTYRSW